MTPGPVRRVRVRLLPWRPRWRIRDLPDSWDGGGLDLGIDDLAGAVLALVLLLAFPVVLFVVFGLLLFSLEIGALLALTPLLTVVQLVGLRPWYLGVTPVEGERYWVEAGSTRAMLSTRRYYRSLRVR